MSHSLLSAIRDVADRIARGEYRDAVEVCDVSRLTADELRDAVLDYGRTLLPIPADADLRLDAVEIADPLRRAWSVRVPLWTREEGRSDLTLELTVDLLGDRPVIHLDDLHVP